MNQLSVTFEFSDECTPYKAILTIFTGQSAVANMTHSCNMVMAMNHSLVLNEVPKYYSASKCFPGFFRALVWEWRDKEKRKTMSPLLNVVSTLPTIHSFYLTKRI